jgi:3-hydroxyisobutyrate dehydrogenase-like beta-hydroxyacid dehydrogenase
MKSNQTVGFIGLGAMGLPMASNLVRAGLNVVAYDLNTAALDKLVELGASVGKNPRDVGERSDVVITMLPKAQHVFSVIDGDEGLYAGLSAGKIHVDMSTIEPSASQSIGAKAAGAGIRMIDSPVGKSTAAAADGTLTIMAGGDRDTFEAVLPLLQIMGEDIHHCGTQIGVGAAVKVVNNLVSGGILVVLAEALGLGAKAGVSAETMVKVLSGTGAANWQLSNTLARKALKGDYEPGFTIALIHKDCGLGEIMSRDLGVEMPVSRLVQKSYGDAVEAGLAGLDWGGYLKKIEQDYDVTLRLETAEAAVN